MSLFNAYVSLSGALDATIKQDEPLSHHSSFRIGGKASLFAAVHSHVALVRVLEVLAANRVDWVLLGKGSNILVSDKGYNGCVIVLDDELSTISVGENNLITAGAGALTARVCNEAMKAGLSGLEMCAGIPGTIGGALSMNAGTRHDWIGKAVRDCVVLKPGKGLVRYDASEIEWVLFCSAEEIPSQLVSVAVVLFLRTQVVGLLVHLLKSAVLKAPLKAVLRFLISMQTLL